MRDIVYPGLDLHTRQRAVLLRYWRQGDREVLDAGSGNGFFSWLAYKSGASVVAYNIDGAQVAKAHAYLINHKRANPARLALEHRSLHDLSFETRRFDEIICYETLEHIKDDADVVRSFSRVLRPGGTLHLCCPFRLHPRHLAERLDLAETGGHVRHGYTDDDYRALLTPLGFQIEEIVGLGSSRVYWADRIMRSIRNRVGDATALPLLPLALLVLRFDRSNPRVPFSLYVRATKPGRVVS